MDHSKFVSLTTQIFEHYAHQIEDQDQDGKLDVILSGDVLTIESPVGIFVLNRHSVLKEIWLASPISGPHHFSLYNQQWQNKNSRILYQILAEEFTQLNIKLEPYEQSA